MSDVDIRIGDSLLLLRDMPSDSIDGVVTDPPYSSGGQFRSDRSNTTTAKYQQSGTEKKFPDFDGDNRDQRSFLAWSSMWLAECWRVARRGAPIAVFIDWRMLPTMSDAIQAGGWIWRGILPWVKPACRPQKGRFAAGAEYVLWGSKGEMPTDRGVPCLPGHIIESSVPTADREHLTEKPIAVMDTVVRIVPSGGTILDPFSGSGTTGVAAMNHGCRFIGMEMSEEYASVTRRRLDEHASMVKRGSTSSGQIGLFTGRTA